MLGAHPRALAGALGLERETRVSEFVRERDGGLDAARGVAIVLVLVAHALEAQFLERPDGVFVETSFRLWQAIYAFHMPLFFLLSGAANRGIATKTGHEVIAGSAKLVLLAWICQIVGATTAIVLGRIPLAPGPVVETLFRPIVVGYDWSTAVIWFLVALAVVRPVVHALSARRSAPAMVAAFVVLGLGAVALVDPAIDDLQQIRTWVPGVFFFALGGWIARDRRRLPAMPFGAVLLVAAIALAPLNLGCRWSPLEVCGLTVLDGHAAVVMVGGFYGNLPLFLITALLGSIGVWSIAAAIRPLGAEGIGRRSLELFLLNGFVLVFAGPIAASVDPRGIVGSVFHVGWVVGAVPLHLALLRLVGGVPAGLITSSEWLAGRLVPKRA